MRPIGGYFELEGGGFKPRHAGIYMNSGCSALKLIVRMLKIKRLHVPYYTCPVVPAALLAEGCQVIPYELDTRLMPIPQFPCEDFVLVNDYFGLTGGNVRELAEDYPNLIVDNAQSYYAEPRGRAAFYSPRKFFGVPDGGIAVFNRDEIDMSDLKMDVSYNRMTHLLKRHDLGAVAAYDDFKKDEEDLCNAPVRGMSRLTRNLLTTIDDAAIRMKRLSNFSYLNNRLKTDFPINCSPEEVPLVFPYVSHDALLRRKLIDAQIFIATYWPGCEYSDSLVNSVLPLPIDQRYGEEDMNHILEIVNG